MKTLIASLIVAGSLVAGLSAASAGPLGGQAAREAAQLGFITVGGAFDAR